MSVISNNPQKKQALWKVSSQTKGSNKQLSVIQPTYQLPQRFSPAKRGPNQSRLFNTSMQKLKLAKFQSKKSRSPTPRSKERQYSQPLQNLNQKSQSMIHPSTPKKQQKMPIVNLQSRDSYFTMISDQAKNINNGDFFNFLQQFQANRKLLLALKEEFTQFKTSVLQQMNVQRKMVLQFITKIQQTCNKKIEKQLSSQFLQVKKVEIKDQEHTSRVLNFQSLIKSAQEKQKQIQTQINNISCNLQAKIFHKTQQQSLSIYSEVQINQPQLEVKNDQKQEKQTELQQNQSPKKSSPQIEKCNQIAETINTLNEINASPVSPKKNAHQTGKSTEKLMIEDYKQKILAITKSNDSLIKQKTRQSLLRTEQQGKIKGNFKLQKFYNAIQKLKEEVNEIKNINQMKQSKKGKY